MPTIWKRVDNKCTQCHKPVAKMNIKSGKIVVEEYMDTWGCWCKVPGKSEMQVMCSECQKAHNKLRRKEERRHQRQNKEKTTKASQ